MHLLSSTLVSLLLLTAPMARGWLGIYLSDSNEAVVSEVIPNSPAAKAGLKAGDVLLAIDDTDTPTREKLVEAIGIREAGDRVKIKLRRGDREQIVIVRLGERPPEGGAGAQSGGEVAETTRRGGQPAAPSGGGARVAPSEDGRGFLGISVRESATGVSLERVLPDGPSANSGLSSGDVIERIADQRVKTLGDLDQVLAKLRPGQRISIDVRSKDEARSVMVRVGARPGSVDRRSGEAPAAEAPMPSRLTPRSSSPSSGVIVVEPSTPSEPEAAKPKSPDPDFDLQRELRELRAELRELRRMLEEMRRRGRE